MIYIVNSGDVAVIGLLTTSFLLSPVKYPGNPVVCKGQHDLHQDNWVYNLLCG